MTHDAEVQGHPDRRPGPDGAGTDGAGPAVRAVVALAAAAFLVPGAWSFLWPESFHRHVARFDPFNLHLFHDLGAFQLGIGVALLGALWWRDALSVALLGATVGSAVHAVSHVLDRNLGGRAGDPWALAVLALVITAALVLRRRGVRAGAAGGSSEP